MQNSTSDLSRRRGFTLIELMIVVAVIAILTTIAVPMYSKQIRESRRADAKTALLDLASREERYYTVNNVYTSNLTDLGYASNTPVALGSSATPDYHLCIASATTTVPTSAATNVTPPAFVAQAVPNGDQVNDSCGGYQLDNLGNQYNSAGVGNACPMTLATAPPIAGCW